jgi:hypothetical protein
VALTPSFRVLLRGATPRAAGVPIAAIAAATTLAIVFVALASGLSVLLRRSTAGAAGIPVIVAAAATALIVVLVALTASLCVLFGITLICHLLVSYPA